MKALFSRLDAAFLRPFPPERLALVRIVTGLFAVIYLAIRIPAFVHLANLPSRELSPVGPLFFLDGPLPARAIYVILGTAFVSGLAFIRGALFSLTAPIFAVSLLVLTSYRSSFGMIFHTENLLVLHVAILALVPKGATLVLAPGRPNTGPPDVRAGWPLTVLGLATVLTYFLAGVAKLDRLGLAWAGGEVLMGHVAYDALRKAAVGGMYSPIGVWLLDLPVLFTLFASVSLVVELAAPLALFHRRIGWIWCGGAWAFHVGVLALMVIGFPYPLSGVAYASFLPLERFVPRGSRSREA